MLAERKYIMNILKALDAFALTTFLKGTPMTILEAMAENLPSIATNVGGIPQVILNNKNGMLVENKDKEGLIRAIESLLEKSKKVTELGRQGRLLLENNYSSKYRPINKIRSGGNKYHGR